MKGILIGIAVFLVIVLLAVGGFKLYDYIVAAEFYNNSEVVFATPGVNDSNFVPQGMTYIPEIDTFLFTGFMGKPLLGKPDDDIAGRVYVLESNGNLTFTRLLNADGTPYTDHTGGMGYWGDYVYITGEDNHGLDVFLAEDILSGKEETRMLGTVKTYNAPAYCYTYEYDGETYMLAGSYYRDKTIYQTPDHERIATPSGEQNTTVMTVFRMDGTQEFGINPTPCAIISARHMIQGICITPDGQMVISSSWGLATSDLLFYDLSKVKFEKDYIYEGTIAYGDFEAKEEYKTYENFSFELPCYFLDDSCLVDTVVAPPMSEGIVCLDGKIIVFCESASDKYFFGKLTTGFKTYGYYYNEID